MPQGLQGQRLLGAELERLQGGGGVQGAVVVELGAGPAELAAFVLRVMQTKWRDEQGEKKARSKLTTCSNDFGRFRPCFTRLRHMSRMSNTLFELLLN